MLLLIVNNNIDNKSVQTIQVCANNTQYANY